MDKQASSSNKLGTWPIGKLLPSIALPIVISMLVQALYNVVDSIFVAQVGEAALTAVSLVFPIQNLMIAVAIGTAVGMNSLLSRRLGEGEKGAANTAAMNGVFLAVLGWLATALLGFLFSDAFFAGYADTDATIASMGASYMRIVTVGSAGLYIAVTFERLLQSTGLTIYSMVSQMTGAVVNIILDPILIFGLFGLPAMGVAGAAWATVIGQLFSLFISVAYNAAKNKELRLRFRKFRPNFLCIRQIYAVGLPAILMQSIGSVMVFFLNEILISFGTVPVSVFGIYFKLQGFVILPVLGFNNGAISILAYNYGAKNPKRISQTLRLTLFITFFIMLAGMVLLWAIPEQLLLLFDAQADMLAIGVPALRTASLGFPLVAVSIALTYVFQAVNQAFYSLIMSVVRQLVFLIPLAFILSQVGGLNALWFAFPIAEVAAMTLAVFYYRRIYKNILKPLQEESAENSG